jgi:hypothetical protein
MIEMNDRFMGDSRCAVIPANGEAALADAAARTGARPEMSEMLLG